MLTLKAGLIFFLQFNIFFITGRSLHFFYNEERGLLSSPAISCCVGFIVYHAMFWFIAYPFALFDFSFKILICIWIIILSLFFFLMITRFRTILKTYQNCIIILKDHALYFFTFFIFASFIVFLSTRNGYLDIDSQTYIGEVTTIIGTNRIMSLNPTTGLPLARSLFLRRGCAMFGAESAFWCRVFNLHPLIYCKIIRAAMNPVLLFIGSFSALRLFHHSVENALLFTIFSCPAFLLFDNSGYTNTRFLLHRGYEGKAYLSGTLIVITILICIIYIREQSRISFILLLLNEIAALSISASSLYLIPPILISVLGAYIITKKEWNKIPLLLVLIVPNAVFALLQAIG